MRRAALIACWTATAACALGALTPSLAAAQAVDPALVEVRRHKSDASINTLSWRHLQEILNTKTVPTGPRTWTLPKSPLSLRDDAPVTIAGKPTTLVQAMQDLRVNAVLVLKDGKIVKELHRNGGREDSAYAGFSMTKSWTSILYGIAQAQGKVGSVDSLVTQYLPELKGTAYEGVTVRHLLTMRAGTSWTESGPLFNEARDGATNTETLYYEDLAKKVTRVAEPGTKFNYSSLDTELVGLIVARATGRPLAEYMAETLWRPAGMEAPGLWILQGPTGRQHEWSGAGFIATLRDYGRIGQMMLDGGKANGRQIVPAAWVEESTRPTAGDNNYYYFWWGTPGMDGYRASGMGGQQVMVHRPSRTVVVLTSYTAKPGLNDLFRSIVKQLDYATREPEGRRVSTSK
jgi:CubicO group peptidase (beta-lactamase class C family)